MNKSKGKKEEYKEGGWDYVKDTPVEIDGKTHIVKMYPGMSGIGSRDYWVDGRKMREDCVLQSGDLTQGNHFLYRIKWRDTPWDRVDVFIHEDELPNLLNKDNEWREPQKINL